MNKFEKIIDPLFYLTALAAIYIFVIKVGLFKLMGIGTIDIEDLTFAIFAVILLLDFRYPRK